MPLQDELNKLLNEDTTPQRALFTVAEVKELIDDLETTLNMLDNGTPMGISPSGRVFHNIAVIDNALRSPAHAKNVTINGQNYYPIPTNSKGDLANLTPESLEGLKGKTVTLNSSKTGSLNPFEASNEATTPKSTNTLDFVGCLLSDTPEGLPVEATYTGNLDVFAARESSYSLMRGSGDAIVFSGGEINSRTNLDDWTILHSTKAITSLPAPQHQKTPTVMNNQKFIDPPGIIAATFGTWCVERGLSFEGVSDDFAFDETIQTDQGIDKYSGYPWERKRIATFSHGQVKVNGVWYAGVWFDCSLADLVKKAESREPTAGTSRTGAFTAFTTEQVDLVKTIGGGDFAQGANVVLFNTGPSSDALDALSIKEYRELRSVLALWARLDSAKPE